MRIFALSDPHYGRDMSRYGPVWIDHETEIRRRWTETVRDGDLVLIPGDISWAATTKAIERHLDEIAALPGRKVLSPGNHDRWWKKVPRLARDGIDYLLDDHLPLGPGRVIAASLGCDTPESPWWKEEMRPELEDACGKLEATLERVVAERPDAAILLMFHYPPRWAHDGTPTAFERILARYPVEMVVYGHIHGPDLAVAHHGELDVAGRRIRYENASCDGLAMRPLELLHLPDLRFEGRES